MPDLIAALRDCVHERGVTFQTVDDIAGLPDRYTSKVLGPVPIKNLGPLSFEGVLGAVGKAMVLVDDPEQMARVQGRWTPRKRPLRKAALSITHADAETRDTNIELQERFLRDHMKKLGAKGGKMGGSKGGKRRAKLMSRRARQRAASHAARMRWKKPKLPASPV